MRWTLDAPGERVCGGGLMFKKLRKMNQIGKEAGFLKADHPGAWALGEDMARQLLADRSPDLVEMMKVGPQHLVDEYVQRGYMMAMQFASEADAPDMGESPTSESLKAVGIACGMYLTDVLERERR
jgi:hypothetical protein